MMNHFKCRKYKYNDNINEQSNTNDRIDMDRRLIELLYHSSTLSQVRQRNSIENSNKTEMRNR